jgi:NADH dehydrogenase [ubiquinone] 1 alpha subcomplex assembly factor 1
MQTVQLPFVDFLLTSLGYVQNEQTELNTRSVKSLGVLLADKIDGPFKLEIRSVRAITMKKLVSNMEVDE